MGIKVCGTAPQSAKCNFHCQVEGTDILEQIEKHFIFYVACQIENKGGKLSKTHNEILLRV